MAGPKTSIVNEAGVWQPPREDPEKVKKPKASDWARLGKSRKYKDVDAYYEVRKEYWRHYLPGGQTFKELYVEDPDKCARWAAVASVIVDEIETMQYRIQVEVGK